MEAPDARSWFLRKHHDGSIFGPVTFDQLALWAFFAQVAPNDSISSDQKTWMKAPMLPGLAMDWIVEVTSERFYGPTTLGAIQEFMRLGEIDEDTVVINSCDASRQQVRDLAPLFATQLAETAAETPTTDASIVAPAATGMSIAVQEKIRQLEEALRDERRAFAALEEEYRALEAKYRAQTAPGSEP
jgi:hypothetical protein